ncbi:family 43 glycosylhydrolase [Nocardioides sp.]|uniref:family 43 glycosylhydrolase n=1 Tax=Nocardioides sp. TaxID=35761 RepID=UPI0039E4E91F
MPRRLPRLALLTVLLLSLTLPAHAGPVLPLEYSQNVADPSVVKTKKHKQYVVVGTGEQVVRMTSKNGRRWKAFSPALITRPTWAKASGDIWAAEMVQLGGRWLLYFAAPVGGMKASSRCIGVAVSASATGQFTPYGDAPLVCPSAASTPPAADQMIDAGLTAPTMASHGAIDPSIYVGPQNVFLLYKTDGVPSSIRLLKLARDGLTPLGEPSMTLVVSAGVVENPVLLKRGKWFYLFTSTGDYSRCSYAETWRRSDSPYLWLGAEHVILSKPKTKLCGPGGGDIITEGKKTTLYFHAWVCRSSGKPCKEPFHAYPEGAEASRNPIRALYAVEVRFTKKKFPVRGKWLKP